MTNRDKLLILRMIKTGDFTIVLQLHTNIDIYTMAKITQFLHSSLEKRVNYENSKKLVNIILPNKSKLKTNLISLFAFELNHYQDKFQRNQAFNKLNTFLTSLLGFPIKKRLVKLLTKFCQASKSLQDLAGDNTDNLMLLKIIKNILLELKNVDSE